MKKAIVLIIILLSSLYVFADERFYCINATDNIGSGNSQYRFNYATVFDLSNYFSGGQNSSYPVYGDYAGKSNPTGPLNEDRAIGTVGVAECSHRIKYTITATNFGRFESQSDPSKYREYYVVVVPDQGTTTTTTSGSWYNQTTTTTYSRYYYYPNGGSSSSKALSTDNASHSFELITTTTNGTVNAQNASSEKVDSMGLDLFICMKELTDDDRLHLAPGDDYFATIIVSWECVDCSSVTHSGSYSITVRGYFGNEYDSSYDEIFLLISPTTESNNMNIKQLATTGNTITISTFQINTVTKRKESNDNAYQWSKHIFAFLSASPYYNTSDANGFLLKKVGNQSITIPYELMVYNTTDGYLTSDFKKYDGTDCFTTGTASEKNMCLAMDNYSKSFIDTYNNGTYNAINYEGEVVLKIKDFEIPVANQLFSVVMKNPDTFTNYYTQYIGRYESNIYYHIVYSDSPIN